MKRVELALICLLLWAGSSYAGEALITKVAQYCNKLLRKPDQCRMISLCSMLFWPPKNPDGTERYSDCDRVLECMQRALKIASVCNTSLFVEILDRCVVPQYSQ